MLITFLTLEIFGQKEKSLNSVLTIPGRFVVKLKGENTTNEKQGFDNKMLAISKQSSDFKILKYSKVFPKSNGYSKKSRTNYSSYYYVNVDTDNVEGVIKTLSKNSEIEYVEPLFISEKLYTPNDANLGSQDYLDVINAFNAWDIAQGSEDIIVAIIDDGVDYLHEDLVSKIYLNEEEIPDNGIDDDQDGFIDNYYGWDFVGDEIENIIEDNDPYPNTSQDHGTRCAGFIAADTDNELGIAGVGFNTKYMVLKAGAENNETAIANWQPAVIYAADHGAKVINMSFGGSGFSQFSQDVMTYAAIEKDVVLVAAAGNDGIDLENYPAAYDHVISVAATTINDTKASFSQFGRWVDISAPGSNVYTTRFGDSYSITSGTSFSTPIVAGAAALLRAHFPSYNQFQISQTLIQTADDISSSEPDFLIGGRLNIEAALLNSTPALRLTDFSILNAESEVPEAGDQAFIDLSIINELNPASSSATLSISEISDIEVSFDDSSPVVIGPINTNESKSFDNIFAFTLPESTPFNAVLILSILLSDDETGFLEEYIFQSVMNPIKTESASTPYLLVNGGDFEAGTGGFASGQISGGIDVWERGEPSNELTEVNSGSNVWKTDLDSNLPKETYSCVLQSPVFDFSDESSEYILSFYKSMESEFCNAPSAVQLQYTIDGGITWNRLGSKEDVLGINWYNKDVNSACQIDDSILEDQEGWLGNFSNEYTEYNASFLGGNSEVIFRFFLSVSGNFESDINDDGFMIDDFEINKLNPRANFFTEETTTYTGRAINFEFLSAGATSFQWDFGDGNSSFEENPVHVYTEPGVYDISLIIETVGGNTKDTIFSNYITILPQIETPFEIADGGNFETNLESFAALNISGTPFERGNSTIEGKDGTASGDFAWVTGLNEDQYQDDSEAYLYSPEFSFDKGKIYTISFDANYSFESQWDGFIIEYSLTSGDDWIKLNDFVADNWYDDISVENAIWGEGIPIFTNSTNGEYASRSSDISFLAGEDKVAFRFVFLTDAATTDVGAAIDNFAIASRDPEPAVPEFTASITGLCINSSVTFTNLSSGDYTNLEWNFGEGANPSTASGEGPHNVIYDTDGKYTVTININGIQNGIQTETKVDYIVVGSNHQPSITSISQGNSFQLSTDAIGSEYQWFVDGDSISGANESSLVVSEDGDYRVDVRIDGCIGSSNNEQIRLVTGIELLSDYGISLYPNPVSNGILTIEVNNKKLINFSIFDISGRVTNQYIITTGNNLIDTRNYKSGVYFGEFEFDDKTITQKIIIE